MNNQLIINVKLKNVNHVMLMDYVCNVIQDSNQSKVIQCVDQSVLLLNVKFVKMNKHVKFVKMVSNMIHKIMNVNQKVIVQSQCVNNVMMLMMLVYNVSQVSNQFKVIPCVVQSVQFLNVKNVLMNKHVKYVKKDSNMIHKIINVKQEEEDNYKMKMILKSMLPQKTV